MPIKVNSAIATGVVDYGNIFVDKPTGFAQIQIGVAALTTAEVDAKGYIKPGVPFLKTGVLVTAAAQVIFGIVPEPIQVAASNSGTDLTAAGNVQITLATIGQVNKKMIEDNLGRVLTANELAAFDIGGCLLKLLI